MGLLMLIVFKAVLAPFMSKLLLFKCVASVSSINIIHIYSMHRKAFAKMLLGRRLFAWGEVADRGVEEQGLYLRGKNKKKIYIC